MLLNNQWSGFETFRFRIRSEIGRHPFFLKAVGLLRGKSHRICNKNTTIVIECYPRSASTYSAAYFKHFSKEQYSIASHQHCTAQLVLAKKYSTPTLIIVRLPFDAILSLKIRRPSVATNELVKEYYNFYASTYAMKDTALIVRFETVINDFSIVVTTLNKKFNTNFPVQRIEGDTKIAIEAIVDKADEEDRLGHSHTFGVTRASHVGKPMQERLANPMRTLYEQEIHQSPYYAKAMAIYKTLLQTADV